MLRALFPFILILFFGLGALPAQAQHVLVLPFENGGRTARFDWIGEGLAELCVERMAGEGRLLYSRDERIAGVERIGLPSSGRFTRATMMKLAGEVDADFVVFGSFVSDGKSLTVTARVLRVEPAGLSEPMTEPGPLEDLMEIHARLAWRLLNAMSPAPAVSHQEFLQAMDRPRLDAFEKYIRGVTDPNEEVRRRYLREAARLMPDWAAPALALGMDAFERKDFTAAQTWFDRVPVDQPGGTQALFYSGLSFLYRNEPAKAETAYSALLERTKSAEAMNNLGVARARQEKWREAAAVWLPAQIQDSSEPDYSFNVGLAAMRNNEPAAAIRNFREAVRRRPDDAEAQALLVAALERSGRMTEAAAERESPVFRVLSGFPPARVKESFTPPAAEVRRPVNATTRATHLKLHLARGREFLDSGKLAEAQREFSEAILIAPESVEAHIGMAQVLERLGRREEAIRELKAALNIESGNVQARRMLNALESGTDGGRR